MDTKTNRDMQIHTHKHPPTNTHTHTQTHTHTHTQTQTHAERCMHRNIRIKKQSNLHKNKFSINRFDCLFTINKIDESDSDINK